MYEMRIHEEADDEFLAAIAYYESHADLGEEFLVELTKGFDQIRKHPNAWPILVGNFRQYLIHRFPYALIYDVEGNTVSVFAVAHTKRAPGYWRERIDVPKFR